MEKGEGNTEEKNPTQNPGENQNSNTGSSDQSGLSPAGTTGPSSTPGDAGGSIPAAKKQFPEPVVLSAVIDPKIKAKEGPVSFNFMKPQQVHQIYSQPSKGDAAKIAAADAAKDDQHPVRKMTLSELDAAIARDEKDPNKYTIDDYADTGEMFVEGWESALTFFSRMISKDHSDSTYEFGKNKKDKLIYQATKVSRKRNWVIPIEYSFLGNLIPASGQILMKASDKRKEYMKNLEKNPIATKEVVNKGGPNKGFRKTRGPGRPSK